MVGAMVGGGVATLLHWDFVSLPGLAAGVAMGVLINGILVFRLRFDREVGPDELGLHAMVDLGALTWLLAWAGGLENPLSVAYSFHVMLGALLIGRQGGLRATVASVLCLALLYGLERFGWLPTDPLTQPPRLLWVASLALLLLGVGYFALVLASRLREQGVMARQEREQAERNLRLLTDALDALQVGLEVRGHDGQMQLRNPFAARLATKVGPEDWDRIQSGDGHLVVKGDEGTERLIDVLAVKPSDDARARLYVDRTEERMVQQRHFMLERLATLGRALQAIAHELNTPLTTMQTLAKDMKAALADAPLDEAVRADVDESVDLIIDESRRCRTLTQSLLQTAHQRPGKMTDETLHQVIEKALRLVGQKLDPERRDVALGVGLDVRLTVDADRVLQILMNLVQNALKACEDLPRDRAPYVQVSAEARPGRLVVRIKDNGPGLPDRVKEHLFEPFVTTREDGEGTGLGLYTSHRIAHELGGGLELFSEPGQGTEAVLSLPGPG